MLLLNCDRMIYCTSTNHEEITDFVSGKMFSLFFTRQWTGRLKVCVFIVLDADFHVAFNEESFILCAECEALEFEISWIAGITIEIDCIKSDSGGWRAVIGEDVIAEIVLFGGVESGAFDDLDFFQLENYLLVCLRGRYKCS